MKKDITIEEMRISSNGKDLEYIISCPDDYYFTEFTIEVNGDSFSVADSVFYEENEDGEKEYIPNNEGEFVGLIPVSLFGVNSPSIYNIHLEASHIEELLEEYPEPDFECELPDDYSGNYYHLSGEGIVRDNQMNMPIVIGGSPKNNYIIDFGEDETPDYENITKYLYLVFRDGSKRAVDEDIQDQFIVNYKLKNCNIVDNDFIIYDINDLNLEYLIVDCPLIEPTIPFTCDKHPELITADVMISDVSHVYHCLTDDIFSIQGKCSDKEAMDRVIRNYLILYAHQEAMRLGYTKEAEKWFGMMANCFTGKCKNNPDRNINSGCGCNLVRPIQEKPSRPIPTCGCKR